MQAIKLNYPGDFIHVIDPRNWLPCYNLKLQPILRSPDFLALADQGIAELHNSLREAPLETLQIGPMPTGALTPRAGNVIWTGAVVRNGGKVGIGLENTKWLPDATQTELLRRADVELAFEKRRRAIVPDAASRLGCLWVAEDSEAGRHNIRSMFGNDPSFRIMRVRVCQYLRVTRADTAWFDRYESGQTAWKQSMHTGVVQH